MLNRCYSDLKQLSSFVDRYRYLRIGGIIGETTFGFDRYLNQTLYKTKRWQKVRDDVIIRDEGCDLGIADMPIKGLIIVHHMNSIQLEDIQEGRDWVFDPEYLICVSLNTHNAIHYGDEGLLPKEFVDRRPGDTCPWR